MWVVWWVVVLVSQCQQGGLEGNTMEAFVAIKCMNPPHSGLVRGGLEFVGNNFKVIFFGSPGHLRSGKVQK